jgi:hypothetical protein
VIDPTVVTEDERRRLAEALAVAAQRRASAEALEARGHAGLAASLRDEAAEVEAAARREIVEALAPLEVDAVDVLAAAPRDRFRRWALGGLRVAAAAAAAWLLLRPSFLVEPAFAVSATATYGGGAAGFAPELAVDGDPATEWLLPDGTTGALAVRVSPPRPLRRVRLRHARGRLDDRATRRWRLTAWSRGEEVLRHEGEGGADATVALDAPAPIEELRVEILEIGARGGGLAELRWE